MIIEKVFILPGLEYHDNKKEIKALIKKHNLKWKGYYPNIFKWKGEIDTIEAIYEKDGEKTIETKLVYKGLDNSDFYIELTKYLNDNIKFSSNTISEEQEEVVDYEKKIQLELEYLKRDGAPPGWIKLREKELRKQYGLECTQ